MVFRVFVYQKRHANANGKGDGRVGRVLHPFFCSSLSTACFFGLLSTKRGVRMEMGDGRVHHLAVFFPPFVLLGG